MTDMHRQEPAGIYVHIPFCERKCPYCDFYSMVVDEQLMDAYTDALIRCLAQAPDLDSVDTLYFGGGTPNLLGFKRLYRILEAVDQRYNLTQGAEITLEANPNSIDADTLSALVRQGFSRISIGVQSWDDRELALLGRLHNANQAKQTVRLACQAGFDHISVDLMVGLPGQSIEQVIKGLDMAAELPIDHMSVYLLKVEEGTPFAQVYTDLDDDYMADIYLSVVDGLAVRGFAQYEISNFSKPGGESRHNLKYWNLASYLGLGPSAHSLIAGRRCYFEADIHHFVGFDDPFEHWVDDGPGGGLDDYIMLGLRTRQGVDLQEAGSLGADVTTLKARILPLKQQGLVALDNGRLHLTPTGYLLSNRIIAHLLGD